MSTHQQPPSQPEIPAELWMLWDIDVNGWLSDGDHESSEGAYLVYLSQQQAESAVAYHAGKYSIYTEAMRVK